MTRSVVSPITCCALSFSAKGIVERDVFVGESSPRARAARMSLVS
jgi:hypothetical protein